MYIYTHVLGNDQRRSKVRVLGLQHQRFQTIPKQPSSTVQYVTLEHEKINKLHIIFSHL